MDDFDIDYDPFWNEYREKRIGEMKKGKCVDNENYGGVVYTGQTDAEILYWTTNTSRVVVHFFHPDFETCAILDQHLKTLAVKYPFIRWVRVSVLNIPFLVTRLKIRVLPRLDMYLHGKRIDRIDGFDDLGGNTQFETRILEKRLSKIVDLTSSPLLSHESTL